MLFMSVLCYYSLQVRLYILTRYDNRDYYLTLFVLWFYFIN